MDAHLILQPVFVVGLLTLAMALWMLVTRIPTMTRMKIHPQEAQNTSKLVDLLPAEVTRISNNYNHLFEQPTLFYAVAIAIALLGHVDTLHLVCAWAYAGLRILHSLVQATIDRVMIRFSLFILSWIALAIMLVREALAVFGM
ncbi:MAPEG family protein [Aestuariirhabdus litorea]|uniref:MAPEG family protein n=1 Tax=Aestuariirhabdus litorea TaxID=2528527 RepID=A0A3P3VJG9_9GAMM|nr:MAPEG family protein [Aestuariirhabdus litorea]RRJ82901.1 MAPEG family protein [Aestuariirhabdus litorea]RWW93060.1 MAPEG family protein [Endozoicomonadaceae bacterium GTF-13]